MANTGELLWSGEHWISYLRRPGEESNSASVGIYHTRYSAAGEGNVALVSIPGDGGVQVAVTDNREVFDFTMDRVRAGSADDPFNDVSFTVRDGRIFRQGDVRSSPSWVIEFEDTRMVVTWGSLVKPVLLSDMPPSPRGMVVSFSVLMFADAGTITLDGKRVPGEPFLREGWRRVTGPEGPASSCCFALAETYTTPAQG